MMNLKRVIISMAIAIFAVLFFNINVKADRYNFEIKTAEYAGKQYFKKESASGEKRYNRGQFIRRTEDNQFVYCLEPFITVKDGAIYDFTQSDYETILNMSTDQWKRVILLAYYGYQYGNHTDPEWYNATQMLIWRTVDPTANIYFTDTANGTRNDSVNADKMAELESLVASHYTTPSFSPLDTLYIGQEITIHDNNNVLDQYSVTGDSKFTATKNGNDLTIKVTDVGNGKITFKKIASLYNYQPVLYYAVNSQKVASVGAYDPVISELNLKSVGGKVSIDKVDKDTGKSIPQGDATLKGAIYDIFKEDGTYVASITTDSEGHAQSDYLPSLGRFYLKERKASTGYELDEEKYYFTIDKDHLDVKVQVKEKVIERDVIFFKVFAQENTGLIKGEPNVTFDIYLKSKNEKVATITTDDRGYATIKLPYGVYVVKQVTATKDYEKVDNFEISINENTDEPYYKLVANAPIMAKLKVVKVDEETGNIIPVKGIKFKIKNLDTNEYVCQTITYPSVEEVCVYETDEDGILYTPYELMPGNYKLEELDQKVDGYLWNQEGLKFTIGEDSKITEDETLGSIMEIRFANKQVKGKIDINKKGEELVIKKGTYKYKKIKLEGAVFEIRANEDIVINGYKYYSNGDLVGTLTTDKDGYATIENLPLGKYTLQEISSSHDNVVDDTIYNINLTYKDQYTEIILKTKNIKNHWGKGTLDFSKTDVTTGKGIPNTKIEIYTENDEKIFEGVTDKDGNITIEDLFVGKFYIVETECATGYKLSNEKVYFEIKEDGEIVKANMTNEKIKSKIKIHKVDEENNSLSGVTFGIFDTNDNLVYKGVTDENGLIEVELEYGSYYFQELESLNDYELNSEKHFFEVKEDGQVIEFTMTNKKKEIKVPDTGENDISILKILAYVLIVMGLGGLGYVIIKSFGKSQK